MIIHCIRLFFLRMQRAWKKTSALYCDINSLMDNTHNELLIIQLRSIKLKLIIVSVKKYKNS